MCLFPSFFYFLFPDFNSNRKCIGVSLCVFFVMSWRPERNLRIRFKSPHAAIYALYVTVFSGTKCFLFWWDRIAGLHSPSSRVTLRCDYYYCFLLKIRVFPITDSDAAGHNHVQHPSAVVSDAHTRRRLFGRRGRARDQKITDQDDDNNNYYIIL